MTHNQIESDIEYWEARRGIALRQVEDAEDEISRLLNMTPTDYETDDD